MTVLEATITLIDAAKQLPEDKIRERAIRRMEKRVRLLQLRAVKRRKWNRRKAFWNAIGFVGGGAKRASGIYFGVVVCNHCKAELNFGDFCKCAEFNGRGLCTSLFCPKCENFLIGDPPEEVL